MDTETKALLEMTHRGGSLGYFQRMTKQRMMMKPIWWNVTDLATVNIPNDEEHIFFGVNPSVENVKKGRGGIDNVLAVSSAYADIDIDKVPGVASQEALHDYVVNLDPSPSAIVSSGSGYQLYYFFIEPYLIEGSMQRQIDIRNFMHRWAEYTHGDPKAKDIARVLRVPNTYNWKYDPPRKAEFIKADFGLTYLYEDLQDLVKHIPLKTVKEGSNENTGKPARVHRKLAAILLKRENLDKEEIIADAIQRSTAVRKKNTEIDKAIVVKLSDGTVKAMNSRSEGEQSIVTSLILKGRSFEEIMGFFEKRKLGHYMEKGGSRTKYLQDLCQNQETFLAEDVNRLFIENAINNLGKISWPGRHGPQDKAVLMGILRQAYQMAQSERVAVSIRELEEYASINGKTTVANSLKRLSNDSDIQLTILGAESGSNRNIYDLIGIIRGVSNKLDKSIGGVRDDSKYSCPDQWTSLAVQELWTSHNLGRVSGIVYASLSADPVSITEISNRIKRNRKTVSSSLQKLMRYNLATLTNRGWIRGTESLEKVADELNCEYQSKSRRDIHRAERGRYYRRKQNVEMEGSQQPLGD